MSWPFTQPTSKLEYQVASEGDIAVVIEQVVDAADRCLRAGFDGIELHAGHGYLIDEFLTPSMNKRTVFWLWLPLALSFTFMMLEGPTVQSAIARLGEPALNLAAFGMVDAGFSGTLTFGALNGGSDVLELPIGERFAQIVFLSLESPSSETYEKRSGTYQGQRGVTLERP